MKYGLTKFLFGIAFTSLVGLGQSHAATIVSNLTDTVNGSGTIYASGPPQDYAQEFTTGTQSVQLGSIIADLGTAVPTFTASAELVANNAGLPGSTILTSFTIPSIPTSSSVDLTFLPTSSIMLSANTNYWFVLSASGNASGSYKWAYTNTLATSLPNYAVSHDGATWSIGSGGPFLIEVDSASAASSAPEPSSLLLVGFAGFLCFGMVRHRKALR